MTTLPIKKLYSLFPMAAEVCVDEVEVYGGLVQKIFSLLQSTETEHHTPYGERETIYQQAYNALTQLVEKEPLNQEARHLRAVTANFLGLTEVAFDDYSYIIANPRQIPTRKEIIIHSLEERADMFIDIGRTDDASEDIEILKRVYPDASGLHSLIAKMHLRNGKYESALAEANIELKKRPEHIKSSMRIPLIK